MNMQNSCIDSYMEVRAKVGKPLTRTQFRELTNRTDTELCNELGIPRKWRNARKICERMFMELEDSEHTTALDPQEFEDRVRDAEAKLDDTSLEEFLSVVAKKQELGNKITDTLPGPDWYKIDLNTVTSKEITVPQVLLFSSDWHLGSRFTDTAALVKHWKAVRDLDNVWVFLLGDLPENARQHVSRELILSQILTPFEQEAIIRRILKEWWKKKIVAGCLGTHDGKFDYRLYGDSPYLTLLREACHHAFGGHGTVEVTVGNQKYTVEMTHQGKGYSMYNPTHAAGRQYREKFPADISVTGHTHRPGISMWSDFESAREMGYNFGGMHIMINMGTFKAQDTYSMMFFKRGVSYTPAVIVYPDKHEMVPVNDIEQAVKYAEYLSQPTRR